MPRISRTSGPIGNGWIEEKRLSDGIHFIAYWKKFVPDSEAPLGRRTEYGGSHDLGKKVKHGDGLTSLSAAKKKWLTICDVITGRGATEHPVEMTDKTFRWFAENVFIPDRQSRWRETTEYTVRYYLDTKLYPAFGDTPLKDMTDAAMQGYLNNLVVEKKYSRTVVQHCLLYLRAILAHAAEDGVLLKNPARKLQMPNGIKKEDRPYLSLADYRKLLEALPSKRDQLMAKLLYTGGLRRGELFGLRWKDIAGTNVTIQRQINRFGKEVDVKTQASEGRIGLPEAVSEDLIEWRKWCAHSQANEFVFPSREGTPINYKNWLDRVLKPAAASVGIERITYHMFRRGLATESHQIGVVDKNIQSQLRHSDPNVTRKLYMREVPAEQQKALELLFKSAPEEKK